MSTESSTPAPAVAIGKNGIIRNLAASYGPGLIVAATVFGAGSIIVASKAATTSGYSLLWVILLAAIFMVLFTRMAARIGCNSTTSMLDQIAFLYNRPLAVLFGIACFATCTGFQSGNNINTGLALHELFPFLSTNTWIVLSFLFIMVLIWTAQSFYQLLEKVMILLVLIMLICFVGNVFFFLPQIRGSELLRSILPSKVTDWQLLVSLSATTFSIVGAASQCYFVQAKGWQMHYLQKANRDASVGIAILTGITCIILITGASVLPAGTAITNVPAIATLLKPLLGSFASILFIIGFFAAAFSSAVANAVIGATFLADAVRLGKSIDDFWVRLFSSIIVAFGMGIGLIFGSNPIQLTIMAQGSTIIGTPLVAAVVLLLCNNKKVVGTRVNGKIENLFAAAATLWLLFLSVNQILLWCGVRL